MIPVFEGFNCRRLDEHDGGSYVTNSCSLQQLRVISVQVVTELESVDESYQLVREGGEFLVPMTLP